jgi:tetratricopeptide (TPR) repeat protein
MVERLRKKAQGLYGEANALVLAGKHQEAISSLTRCLELDPNDVKAYQLRANMLRLLRDWDGALADLKRALAICHTKQHEYEVATRQVQEEGPQAEEMGGPFGLGLTSDSQIGNIGGVLAGTQLGVQTALGIHSKTSPFSKGPIEEIENQLALTFNDLGLEYMATGKFPSAIACLTKAIGLHAEAHAYLLNRGECYRLLNDLERALADFQQAQERKPG